MPLLVVQTVLSEGTSRGGERRETQHSGEEEVEEHRQAHQLYEMAMIFQVLFASLIQPRLENENNSFVLSNT